MKLAAANCTVVTMTLIFLVGLLLWLDSWGYLT